MNVETLRKSVEIVLSAEDESRTGRFLEQMATSYLNLVQNSSAVNLQQSAAAVRDQFVKAAQELSDALSTPAGRDAVAALHAERWTLESKNEVLATISENNGLPSVAAQKLKELSTGRSDFIGTLRETYYLLDHIGYESSSMHEPAAIGFLLPRAMFTNRLSSFAGELRDIDIAVRAFSELATGSVQDAEIVSIETSDPLIFLSAHLDTIRLIVHAANFAAQAVNSFIGIRTAFAEFKKLAPEQDLSQIQQTLDDQIISKIRTEVGRQIEENSRNISENRDQELRRLLERGYMTLVEQIEAGAKI